jgi:hypothetical protein
VRASSRSSVHIKLKTLHPFRTSKTANKLKVLPSTATPIDPIEEEDDDDADEETVERPKRSAKAAAVENESGGVEVSPMRPLRRREC